MCRSPPHPLLPRKRHPEQTCYTQHTHLLLARKFHILLALPRLASLARRDLRRQLLLQLAAGVQRRRRLGCSFLLALLCVSGCVHAAVAGHAAWQQGWQRCA